MLITEFREEYVWKPSLILIVMYTTSVAHGERCVFNSPSPTCQRLYQIRQSMDETVNPCDDFFGYACNNWGRHRSTPNYDNAQKMLDYQIHYKMISVMDSLDQESLPLHILNETHIYYKSCLNAQGTRNSLAHVLEIIKPGKDLDWPILQELKALQRGDWSFSVDNWPAERFDPFALLGHLRSYGLNDVMFNLNIMRNSSDTVMADFSPNPFRYSHFDFFYDYEDVANLLRELGLPNEAVSYYTQHLLRNHQYWDDDLPGRQNKSTYITNYAEMKVKFPYLATTLENIQIHRFADKDMIRLTSLEYFEFLKKKPWNLIEKRNTCNFIMLRLLHHMYGYMGGRFTKVDCIQEVRLKLDLPLNVLYYAYIYRPDELRTNADIEGIFQKTRDYMMPVLEKLPDVESHEVAEIKLQLYNTSLNMGNMPRNMSVLYFDKLYGDLPKLSVNDFYGNKLKLLKHLSRLPLIVERNTTYYHYYGNPVLYRSLQRPFYLSISKLLILPFANLQTPLYHYTFDPIFKWSTLPYFLAHGLYGKLPFVNDFDSNTYNFHRTTIVDLLYRAYVEEQKNRLQPDFTNISWNKLFFLSLGQSFCTTDAAIERDEFALFLNRFSHDVKGFVEAFHCNSSAVIQNQNIHDSNLYSKPKSKVINTKKVQMMGFKRA